MSNRILADLEQILRERLVAAPQDSYSATLLHHPERAARKIMEEAFELCWELGRHDIDRDRAAKEAADLMFHMLVGLVGAGVDFSAVLDELEQRRVGATR